VRDDEDFMVPTAKEIFSRTKLLFFRTKYPRFKGNKSRYIPKRISYLL